MNEILKHTMKESWRHCARKENPVDLLFRSLTTLELSDNALGSIWLLEFEDLPTTVMIDDCIVEVKGS